MSVWINNVYLFVCFISGSWSRLVTIGSTPPPCWKLSFVKVGNSTAIMFGGHFRGYYSDRLYKLDLNTRVCIHYIYNLTDPKYILTSFVMLKLTRLSVEHRTRALTALC